MYPACVLPACVPNCPLPSAPLPQVLRDTAGPHFGGIQTQVVSNRSTPDKLPRKSHAGLSDVSPAAEPDSLRRFPHYLREGHAHQVRTRLPGGSSWGWGGHDGQLPLPVQGCACGWRLLRPSLCARVPLDGGRRQAEREEWPALRLLTSMHLARRGQEPCRERPGRRRSASPLP